MSLPTDALVRRFFQYIIDEKRASRHTLIDVPTLKAACSMTESEFLLLMQYFRGTALQLHGMNKLQVSDEMLRYEQRLPKSTFSDALQFVRQLDTSTRQRRMLPILAAIASREETPGLTLKAILEFGARVDDGRLVEAVAVPWFEIMKMIKRDPTSIYQIDPFAWEELIAGAYTRAGFDEVILTPRSGDKGRDVIATKHGIGSIRFFDQVKAYKPGHLVTAEEVRAMVGTITTAQNVSKGNGTYFGPLASKSRA